MNRFNISIRKKSKIYFYIQTELYYLNLNMLYFKTYKSIKNLNYTKLKFRIKNK